MLHSTQLYGSVHDVSKLPFQRRSLDPADVATNGPAVRADENTNAPPVAAVVDAPTAPSVANDAQVPQAPAPPAAAGASAAVPATAAAAPALRVRRYVAAPELCLDIMDDMSKRWRSLEVHASFIHKLLIRMTTQPYAWISYRSCNTPPQHT
jgi:uncharacterized membrane protein